MVPGLKAGMPSPGYSARSAPSSAPLSFSATAPYALAGGGGGSFGSALPVCLAMASRINCSKVGENPSQDLEAPIISVPGRHGVPTAWSLYARGACSYPAAAQEHGWGGHEVG